jgi:hypothetical protein
MGSPVRLEQKVDEKREGSQLKSEVTWKLKSNRVGWRENSVNVRIFEVDELETME